jgi:hypothetical protein
MCDDKDPDVVVKHFGDRTNFVEFTRQLKPQPPADSHPYWCGFGDLCFMKKGRTVWEQSIPEASLFFQDAHCFHWLDVPRIFIHGCRVYFDVQWGWILEFRLSHEEAAKVWAFLFEHHPEFESRYERETGQFFVKRENVDAPKEMEGNKK